MSFRLRDATDTDFNKRVDVLFGTLQDAACDLLLPSQPSPVSSNDLSDSHQFIVPSGRAISVAKRGPRGRGQNAPDYLKNPNKWTRYSMEETVCLNDHQNQQAGIDLLRELRERKQSKEDPLEDVQEKIIFHKPAVRETTDQGDLYQERPEDAIFGGQRKLVMPEYEVGKTTKKRSGKKINKDNDNSCKVSKQELQLSHLMNYDDEDN